MRSTRSPTRSTSRARGWRGRRPTRGRRKRPTARASSPGQSGRPTAPCRSPRTSTTRRSAPSRSTSCAPRIEEQVRGLIDGGADVLLLETIFDTLGAKAAHRRDRERVRGEGRPAAADDLGHDHRPKRPHAVGPDARRVLRLDPSRAAVQRRHQLRPRRARHAPVHRRARAHRRMLRHQLPERRSAQRLRRVRRAARRKPPRCSSDFATSGFVNIARRLLRHDAGAHRRGRDRRSTAWRRDPCRYDRQWQREGASVQAPPRRPAPSGLIPSSRVSRS